MGAELPEVKRNRDIDGVSHHHSEAPTCQDSRLPDSAQQTRLRQAGRVQWSGRHTGFKELTARASGAPLDVRLLPRTTHHTLQAPIYEMEAVLKTTHHGASGEECTTAVVREALREAGTRRLQLLAVQTDSSCSQDQRQRNAGHSLGCRFWFNLFLLRPPPCNFQRENTKQETDLVSKTYTVC